MNAAPTPAPVPVDPAELEALRETLTEACKALMVYEGLPRDLFPGPPTTALRLVRAALAANGGKGT